MSTFAPDVYEPMNRLKHGSGSGHDHNKRIYIHYTYKHVFTIYINIVLHRNIILYGTIVIATVMNVVRALVLFEGEKSTIFLL